MSEFYSVVTNIGRAQIATAIAGETSLGLKSIAVGDGNGNPRQGPGWDHLADGDHWYVLAPYAATI